MQFNPAQSHSGEKVELFFSCKKLINKDFGSKSDPFVKLYELLQNGNKKHIGTSEVVENNLNPDFEKSFQVEYNFESNQKFFIEVFDVDDRKKMKGDFLGESEFALGEVLSSKFNLMIYDLNYKNKKKGKLVVRVEQQNDLQKFDLKMSVKLSNIPKMGFFASHKTFVEIRKQRVTNFQRNELAKQDASYTAVERDDWQLVYRSEERQGGDVSFNIPTQRSAKFCDNDMNLPLKLFVMKYKGNGSHYPLAVGTFQTNHLAPGRNCTVTIEMLGKAKSKPQLGADIHNFVKKEIVEFSDYLKGGVMLNQFVGVDFTGSNGHPTDNDSLHFRSAKLNEYQFAILSLGEILGNYSQNGYIGCYGFGACINGAPVTHAFPLNLNPENPYLGNFPQLMEAYNNVFNFITLNGPTNFAPLIRVVREFTLQTMKANPMAYTVYVILTDGIISDMEQTTSEIVLSSSLPLSIIIIGRDFHLQNLYFSKE